MEAKETEEMEERMEEKAERMANNVEYMPEKQLAYPRVQLYSPPLGDKEQPGDSRGQKETRKLFDFDSEDSDDDNLFNFSISKAPSHVVDKMAPGHEVHKMAEKSTSKLFDNDDEDDDDFLASFLAKKWNVLPKFLKQYFD